MFDLPETINVLQTPPEGYFSVVASFDGITTEPLVLQYHASISLDEVLRFLRVQDDEFDFVTIFVDDILIPQQGWQYTKPKAGTTVFVKLTPEIQAVVQIAAMAIGSMVKSAIVATAFGATVLGTIVAGVAGTLVAMAVTSILSPRSSSPLSTQITDNESPSFSISNARNQARPFGVVPCVLGQHKVVPPYAAPEYTEVVGDDQFLRFVVAWGYGPVQLSDLKIGNTPIDHFEDVELEHDLTGGNPLSTYPKEVRQENLQVLLDTTYQSRTTELEVDEIGITITWPRGLFKSTSSGRKNHSVSITAQYRRVGGSWVTFLNKKFTDDTAELKRHSKRVTGLSRGQYEVRMLRSALDTTDDLYSEVQWTALRSFKNENPVNNEFVAKTAVRIRASDQLSGIVDQLNGIVKLLVPTWNGTSWSGLNATSNPAAIYRYLMTGAPNKNSVSVSQIEDDELGDWYDECVAKGYTFNQVIDYRASVWDLMIAVARAGHATPRISDNGKFGVHVEKKQSVVVQHFSPRNTDDFSAEIIYHEIPHAIRVPFFNEDKGYVEDEYIIYDDGYNASNATLYQSMDFQGITNADNVYKLGRLFLASLRLRPEVWKFSVDWQHLFATRGSLVRLSHDVSKIGLGTAVIKNISGNVYTFDDFFTLVSGTSYSIRIRTQANESVTKTFTATSSGSVNSLTLTGLSNVNVGDLIFFGEASQETVLAIVKDIESQGELGAVVTCVPYHDAIYEAADTIPEYESVVSEPTSLSFEGPQKPYITDLISGEEALVKTATGDIMPSIRVYFKSRAPNEALNRFAKPARYFQARFRESNSDRAWTYTPWFPADTRYIMLQPVETGRAYDIGVQAIYSEDKISGFVEETGHVVIGASEKPPAVNKFVINTINDQTYVEWTYDDIPIDCTGFELRFSPSTDITEWREMMVISDSVSAEARSHTVPSRQGTYAIKPFDVLGNRANEALFINASMLDPERFRNVTTITEHPDWSGTKTQIAVNPDGNLQLESSEFMADWAQLSDVITLYYGEEGVHTEGYYEFDEVDLGAVFTTRVLWDATITTKQVAEFMVSWDSLSEINPLAGSATGDPTNVRLEVKQSTVDSATPNYGEWRPVIVGDYTGRYLKFRLKITTRSGAVTPIVSALKVYVNALPMEAHGSDLTTAGSVRTVVVTPKFQFLEAVAVTPQDMQAGDYHNVTNKQRDSFDVAFYDSDDNLVDRTFDYYAVGYGRERNT